MSDTNNNEVHSVYTAEHVEFVQGQVNTLDANFSQGSVSDMLVDIARTTGAASLSMGLLSSLVNNADRALGSVERFVAGAINKIIGDGSDEAFWIETVEDGNVFNFVLDARDVEDPRERAVSADEEGAPILLTTANTRVCGWFDLAHNDNSLVGRMVTQLKRAFYKGLSKDYSNPSTKWRRIRDYARELAEGAAIEMGYIQKAQVEESAEGDAGTDTQNQRQRDPFERIVCQTGECYRMATGAARADEISNHAQAEFINAFVTKTTALFEEYGIPTDYNELKKYMDGLKKR